MHTVAKDRYNRLIYCGSSMWFYIHTYRIARRNIHNADKVKTTTQRILLNETSQMTGMQLCTNVSQPDVGKRCITH